MQNYAFAFMLLTLPQYGRSNVNMTEEYKKGLWIVIDNFSVLQYESEPDSV